VLEYLGRFLDVDGLVIASRWHGVYVRHASEPFCLLHPAPQATALVGFGGAGMTLSFGAAEEAVAAASR
jgi:D-hydroxyproline dehydrogenase subunit beta